MARTRVTIRRIDPWSILKFGFVANLVLLGVQLLAGAVIWYVVQRLELIETVCELAATVGFEECGVDGSALFDTFLVLGLLGVVIQTGILVFLAFLANLIFDLTGGIGLTLEGSGPAPGVMSAARSSAPRGARAGAAGGAGGAAAAQQRASREAPAPQQVGGEQTRATPEPSRDDTAQIPSRAASEKASSEDLFGGA